MEIVVNVSSVIHLKTFMFLKEKLQLLTSDVPNRTTTQENKVTLTYSAFGLC